MNWWLLFAVFLYLVTAVLIIAEVFVPSGGIISICALGSLIGGLAIFYNYSMTAGWVGLGIAVVMIPAVVIFAYRVFPKTSFGKAVTLTPPDRHKGDAIPDTPQLKEMLDAVGVVITPLRPVGMCDFSGKKIECVAESGYIDKDSSVKVIKIEAAQLTVRLIEES